MSSEITEAEAAIPADALADVIALARRLKHQGRTNEVARRYGYEAARILYLAGVDRETAGKRLIEIWDMVQEEAHA